MKPDQQAALNLPPQPASTAFECKWEPAAPNKVVNLDVVVGGDYLGQVFRESNDDSSPGAGSKKWETFEPIEVAGQPAVLLGVSTNRFNCNVLVGAGPEDSFMVTVIAEDRKADSCPRTVAIAEQVVRNLAG